MTRKMAVMLIGVLVWVLAPGGQPPAQAATLNFYVATTGVDTGDCNVSANPCQTVGYAMDRINALVAHPDVGVLAMGPGVFTTPNTTWSVDFMLFVIGAGPNLTFLDGGNTHRTLDFSLSGNANVNIIDLAIQNGNAPTSTGGGGLQVFSTNSNSLTLSNVHIRDNTADFAGGVYLSAVDTSVLDSAILNNSATNGFGGGFSAVGGTIDIQNTEIAHNTIFMPGATLGGGVYLVGADFSLNRVWVHHNQVTAGDSFGAGIYITGDVDSGSIRNSVFSNNLLQADTDQGLGAGLYCNSFNGLPISLINNTFSHNRIEDLGQLNVGSGMGAFITGNCTTTFVHNTFAYNHMEIFNPPVAYIARTLNVNLASTLHNNVVGGTTGGLNCAFTPTPTTVNNLDDDNSCINFSTAADIAVAPLSVVSNYPWPMNPPWPHSPVILASSANCQPLDARNISRSSPCNLGAYEGNHYPAFLPSLRR